MDFSECYRTLGVEPGCDWNALTAAYRRLVQKWHPDRYPAQSKEQADASRRMLELNKSYEILSDFYRHHGALPYPAAETPRADQTDTVPSPRAVHAKSPPSSGRAEADIFTPVNLHARRNIGPRAGSGLAAVVMVILVGYFIYISLVPQNVGQGREQTAGGGSAEWSAAPTKRVKKPYRTPFGLGSTPGEVLDAQGLPTRTAGDLWFYGDSEVYFDEGVVASWHSGIKQPLNVHSGNAPAAPSPPDDKPDDKKDKLK